MGFSGFKCGRFSPFLIPTIIDSSHQTKALSALRDTFLTVFLTEVGCSKGVFLTESGVSRRCMTGSELFVREAERCPESGVSHF